VKQSDSVCVHKNGSSAGISSRSFRIQEEAPDQVFSEDKTVDEKLQARQTLFGKKFSLSRVRHIAIC
jgi:hypothetical protein